MLSSRFAKPRGERVGSNGPLKRVACRCQNNRGLVVSLNHKRRIFRPNAGAASSRGLRLPSPGVLLAAAGGMATLVVAASLFVRSSDAPALATANTHLSADAEHLAVLDGDTLRVGDHVVRLEGIVAPARGSVCHGGGQLEIDCGSAAANALASLVRGMTVDCTIDGHDGHGRPVGNCQAGGKPLSQTLVRDGWARADADDLREPEAAARAAGRGVWRMGS
jgi:endonuclease YncB( thermonuclease family)